MNRLFSIFALVIATFLSTAFSAQVMAQDGQDATAVFQDDPAAHALYDKMVEAIRSATSLYYEADYRMEARDYKPPTSRYTIWMKKPNYFRVEGFRKGETDPTGIIVGDGNTLWIYWPKGKPQYGFEYDGKYGELYEQIKDISYIRKRAPLAMHSIGHEAGEMGVGISMTILDPSTFHGYTDSLQRYIDGVRSLGTKELSGEKLDVIEVSIMKNQRSWELWLSQKDHLPRRLKQTVRVSYDILSFERWSNIKINQDMSDTLFDWKPPEGWREWRMPDISEGLLEPGTPAPDFELTSIDGEPIKLSDYKGKIVWLYIWRAG